MKIGRVPEHRTCPRCGAVNTGYFEAVTSEDRPPQPGDVSICWECGGMNIFTERGVRLPTSDEQAELSANPNIQEGLAVWRAYRAMGYR